MFFRALSLKYGLQMFVQIFRQASFQSFFDGKVFKLGMDPQDFVIVAVVIVFVFVISLLKERGCNVRGSLMEKNMAVRSLVTVLMIAFIILFGAYGTGYVPVDPIYANF